MSADSKNYVIEADGPEAFKVQKYDDGDLEAVYLVKHGACDCWGFKSKKSCKHLAMVAKFDPAAMASYSKTLSGVRDEVAQAIYARVLEAFKPFVEHVDLLSMERHTDTDKVIGIKIRATPKADGDRIVMKLTGYIDGVAVEVRFE